MSDDTMLSRWCPSDFDEVLGVAIADGIYTPDQVTQIMTARTKLFEQTSQVPGGYEGFVGATPSGDLYYDVDENAIVLKLKDAAPGQLGYYHYIYKIAQ